jgi:hypothetical protein
LTGTDGAHALSLYGRPGALDVPNVDVLVASDDEYFVDWQVADIAPLTRSAAPENQILFR